MTPDGWLHTGDVGEWVDGTHVKITDRAKDIIITAGGKNIAPSEIENALKASPYIKEAIVIGDRRPYLAALIGIELDTVGDWAQRRGIAYTTYRDLSEQARGASSWSRPSWTRSTPGSRTVEQIKKFRMLPKELDHEDGELTATQKVQAVRDRRRSSATWSRTCTREVGAMTETPRESSAAGWASAACTRCWRSASSSSTRRPG